MSSLVSTTCMDSDLVSKVQELERELTEARQQQTATAEVLRVISSSAFDLQKVLETIAEGAVRLCGGLMGGVFRYDGELLHLGALVNFAPGTEQAWQGFYPRAATPDTSTGRAILERAAVITPDVEADTMRAEWARARARIGGYRSAIAVPMLREGVPVGAIVVCRARPGTFPESCVDLLKTFADQAVVAIENTRLLDELSQRNDDFSEALEYQNATSEVLGVISRSPTNVQPVFDMIARNAARLCEAQFCFVYRFDGKLMHFVGHYGVKAEGVEVVRRSFPAPPNRGSAAGRAMLNLDVVQIPDVTLDPDFALGAAAATAGYRSAIAVPMVREGQPIGSIAVARAERGLLPDRQVQLLRTFADQAVIAIENTRLFDELQTRTHELTQSVAELEALGAVGQTISSSLDLSTVLATILRHACDITATGSGAIYVLNHETGELVLEANHNMNEELISSVQEHPIRLGEALIGQCVERREAMQIEDLEQTTPHPVFALHLKSGVRALLAVPLLHQDKVIGALVVRRRRTGEFAPDTVQLLQAFAAQSSVAIANARLFREIEDKSEQLRIASLHKSQFLANMSHELRTPLNAILGYTELIQDGVYGEPSQQVSEVLGRVQTNGKHLLGLINDVLDLSKIEAGQLVLRLEDYSLSDVVQTVVTATGSLAAEKKLNLVVDVPHDLPTAYGDQTRIAQVLLNLVGNAIKFTDVGRVKISAAAKGKKFTIRVADTGPGIAQDEQARIFEEFHQVDSSATKRKGGTGLGLAISKRIVDLHGGRVTVDSVVGKGSTFRIDLPIRVDKQKGLQVDKANTDRRGPGG
jgi:signal transduction histidine kinase